MLNRIQKRRQPQKALELDDTVQIIPSNLKEFRSEWKNNINDVDVEIGTSNTTQVATKGAHRSNPASK